MFPQGNVFLIHARNDDQFSMEFRQECRDGKRSKRFTQIPINKDREVVIAFLHRTIVRIRVNSEK